jgi:hypothetical protein
MGMEELMEIKEVVVHSIDGAKYQIQFERSAVKGQDGFKITANSDQIEDAKRDIENLYQWALKKTTPYIPEVKQSE